MRPQPCAANYAVLWLEQETSGELLAGKLELCSSSLVLEGGVREARRSLEIPYRELASVTVNGALAERLRGLPALRLERRTGHGVNLASLAGTGVLFELSSYLTALIAT